MRISRLVTVSGGSLFDLMKLSNEHTDGILLKHVSGVVNYGAKDGDVIPLTTGLAPVILPSTNTKSIFVSGGGVVAVGLF